MTGAVCGRGRMGSGTRGPATWTEARQLLGQESRLPACQPCLKCSVFFDLPICLLAIYPGKYKPHPKQLTHKVYCSNRSKSNRMKKNLNDQKLGNVC